MYLCANVMTHMTFGGPKSALDRFSGTAILPTGRGGWCFNESTGRKSRVQGLKVFVRSSCCTGIISVSFVVPPCLVPLPLPPVLPWIVTAAACAPPRHDQRS